jgi:hypothetical protein
MRAATRDAALAPLLRMPPAGRRLWPRDLLAPHLAARVRVTCPGNHWFLLPARAGHTHGARQSKGYSAVGVNGQSVQLHRVIGIAMENGQMPLPFMEWAHRNERCPYKECISPYCGRFAAPTDNMRDNFAALYAKQARWQAVLWVVALAPREKEVAS